MLEKRSLTELLEAFREGRATMDEVLGFLGHDVSAFATLDVPRQSRTGIPEVIYGESKTPEQVVALLKAINRTGQVAIATRVADEPAAFVRQALPHVEDHRVARVMVLPGTRPADNDPPLGTVGVVSAGTSDIPVAEEAAVVLEALGQPLARVRDVGVAGLHRIFPHLEVLRGCRVLVVVAGMEGALPGVVAGLVGRPVIAVPTSVGYGAAFGGVAALLGMLNACAPGVSVVNIDNGFGAACQALLMNKGR